MSKNLEDFIRKNRQAFDEHEPPEHVWQNIQKNLPHQPRRNIIKLIPVIKYAVAAAIAGIIVIALLFTNNKEEYVPQKMAVNDNKQKYFEKLIVVDTAQLIAKKEPEKPRGKVLARNKIHHKKIIKKKKTIIQDDAYQPHYVVINGKPITSEDEALKITQESMNLLATSMGAGLQELKTLQHLSIHF